MINVGSFLRPELVVELDSLDRSACIQRMLDAVAKADVVPDPQVFAERILAREEESSTAIGMGVAIPHARLPELPEMFVAFGRHKTGIDYAAMDGAPVHMVFLIGATMDQQTYLKLIMRISWLVRNDDLREEIMNAPDTNALYQLLEAY